MLIMILEFKRTHFKNKITFHKGLFLANGMRGIFKYLQSCKALLIKVLFLF